MSTPEPPLPPTPAEVRFRKRSRWIVASLFLAIGGLLFFLLKTRRPWDLYYFNRLAAGHDLNFRDFVSISLWWAALANCVIASLLLVTRGLWFTPIRIPPAPPRPASPMDAWRFHLPVLGAMLVCFYLGTPRLSLSLWGDEEYSLREEILGEYKVGADGVVGFSKLGWDRNLWVYKNPNNHFLFTLLSRLSLDTWKFSHPHGLMYNEAALRLPAFLAGIASIAAVAALLRHFGFSFGGVIAAWFLAIHPWHIRYATEARGYSLVLLFAPLGIICLDRAIKEGRWRWWVGQAACGFCMLYSYPAAIYPLIVQNLAALVLILTRGGEKPVRWQLLARLVVAHLVAAMLAIQLLAPAIPQMSRWLAWDRSRGDLGWNWIVDFWGYLTSGMSWFPWDTSNPLCFTVSGLKTIAPFQFWLLAAVLPALLILGIFAWVRKGREHAAFAVAMCLAAPLGFLQAKSSGHILYVWYLIYALPLFAAFVGSAFDGQFFPKRRWIPASTPVRLPLALLFLGLYWQATDSQRDTLRNHPIEPQRESVLATRPSVNPADPRNRKILTAEILFTTPTYDPLATRVESPAALKQLMRSADQRGKQLFVNFGSPDWTRTAFPDLLALVENPAFFERKGIFYGLDVQNTRVVYRYLPGSLAIAENSAF